MTEQSGTPAPDGHAWMSVDQAAPILGLSPSTIRRRIEQGRLEGYQVKRAQGSGFSWNVLVELGHLQPAADASPEASDASAAPEEPEPDASTPFSETPAEIQKLLTLSEQPGIVELVRELMLAPMERQYTELHEQLDRRTDALLASRELIGRQDVELRQLRAQLVEVERQLADARTALAQRAVVPETPPDVSEQPGGATEPPASVLSRLMRFLTGGR